MLNNPWMVPGHSGLESGSGHVVVQTQSVSISSGDGSIIQTNTYESWVTMTGPQPMGLSLAQSAPPQGLLGSFNMGSSSIVTQSPSEAVLTMPTMTDRMMPLHSMPSESMAQSMPGLTIGLPSQFSHQTTNGMMEPVVALSQQMPVSETPLLATMDGTGTYIAVPVSGPCDQLITVPSMQNMYSPMVGTGVSSPQIPTMHTYETVVPPTQEPPPSWYVVVQNPPESSPVVNSTTGTSPNYTMEEELICSQCSLVFEKKSCLAWHLRSCRGTSVSGEESSPSNTPTTTTVDYPGQMCILCKGIFSVVSPYNHQETFMCYECKEKTVFSEACVKKEFQCSECSECFTHEFDLEEHQTTHKSSVTICELPDSYVTNTEDDVCVKIEPPNDSDEDSNHESESSSVSEEGLEEIESNEYMNSDTCPECGKTFSCTQLLKAHVGIHPDIRSYGCTKCGEICVGMYNLQQHSWTHSEVLRMEDHDKERNHEDMEEEEDEEEEEEEDEEEEEEEEEEENEDEEVEEGEEEDCTKDSIVVQPFGCAECGRQFSNSNDLKEHCVTHLHAKPFSCTQCGERFENTATLESHWASHVYR